MSTSPADGLDSIIELQQQEINRLNEELTRLKFVDGRKFSHCCNAILMPFISMNMKMCTECRKEYNWGLDHDQAPIFDGKHPK